MKKKPGQLYQERLRRIQDAIQLEVPDRVPILMNFGLFPARYTGITYEEAYYDSEKWMMANKKAVLDFEPDMYKSPEFLFGDAYEILKCRHMKWPGHGVSSSSLHQFVEGEYMKADEYDAFISDPTGFAITTYIPRIFGTLEPFQMLPSLIQLLIGTSAVSVSSAFAIPEVAAACDSFYKAGQGITKCLAARSAFDKEKIGRAHV